MYISDKQRSYQEYARRQHAEAIKQYHKNLVKRQKYYQRQQVIKQRQYIKQQQRKRQLAIKRHQEKLQKYLDYQQRVRNYKYKLDHDPYARTNLTRKQAIKMYWKNAFTYHKRSTKEEYAKLFLLRNKNSDSLFEPWNCVIPSLLKFMSTGVIIYAAYLQSSNGITFSKSVISLIMLAVEALVFVYQVIKGIPHLALISRRMFDEGETAWPIFAQMMIFGGMFISIYIAIFISILMWSFVPILIGAILYTPIYVMFRYGKIWNPYKNSSDKNSQIPLTRIPNKNIN